MPDFFPTALFGFKSQDVDIERQTISGGTALSGETDVIETDGGGRVYAEFGDGDLIDRDRVLAWRALVTQLAGGTVAMEVPFCDIRHQPHGGEHIATYGDGAVHSDGTPFAGGGPFGEATAAAALRATSLEFNGAFSRPLIGGEWFSIDHGDKGVRAYRVAAVEGSILRFMPPLRKAIPVGQALDFSNPRCLMRVDPDAPKPSSRINNKRHTVAAVRFIEDK